MKNTQYENALAYATKKHNGQTRKGGEPYIIHPIAVAEMLGQKGYDINYQLSGLFHDLLEDTDATEEEILSLSNEKVLEAVKLLTKENGYIMSDYIGKIKENEIAFQVKAADRLHNLRCAVDAAEEFRKKYIAESREWYMDFWPEIIDAIEALEKTIEK